MASIRIGKRKDGSTYVQVLYRHDGRQTSTSFESYEAAAKFRDLVTRVGPDRALETLGAKPAPAITVEQWVRHYLDHRTGLAPDTLADYRRILAKDISPMLGEILLIALSADDVALWINSMEGAAANTITNKVRLLSGALNSAVRARKITHNPIAGLRLPRTTKVEMRVLSKDEFARLCDVVDPFYRPFVVFLAASGCRFSEATALRPSDINQTAGTVRITRAWKRRRGGEAPVLGPPKSPKSVRTLNVPAAVLGQLDYGRDWLFTTPDGRPIRNTDFHRQVWGPAMREAKLDPKPRVHDLRHCCASWLITAGVPLAVVQMHMGHQSISTTIAVYTHLDRTAMVSAADALEGFLP